MNKILVVFISFLIGCSFVFGTIAFRFLCQSPEPNQSPEATQTNSPKSPKAAKGKLIDSPQAKKIELEIQKLTGIPLVMLQEDQDNPSMFYGMVRQPTGVADLKVECKDGKIVNYDFLARADSFQTRAESFQKERYYRDSTGTLITETLAETGIANARKNISMMRDPYQKAYLEGVLRFVEEEWARTKAKGPEFEK